MHTRQQEFFEFAYTSGALKFGEFILNSGRTSPYFLNTGGFSNGADLMKLSGFYADTIAQRFTSEFMLYGPAYKGIPLAAATAISLNYKYNRSVSFAFDRKEVKDHGELGWIVGAPLTGDVVIVEDVITSGHSVDKAVDTIQKQGARPVAVVISLDRMEKCVDSEQSAVQQVRKRCDVDVLSVATFNDLLEFVDNKRELNDTSSQLKAYGKQYVVDSPTLK